MLLSIFLTLFPSFCIEQVFYLGASRIDMDDRHSNGHVVGVFIAHQSPGGLDSLPDSALPIR